MVTFPYWSHNDKNDTLTKETSSDGIMTTIRKIIVVLFYECKATDKEIPPDTEKYFTHANSDLTTDLNL
jgi:hypothetical protein